VTVSVEQTESAWSR